jgi:hypothetical protein
MASWAARIDYAIKILRAIKSAFDQDQGSFSKMRKNALEQSGGLNMPFETKVTLLFIVAPFVTFALVLAYLDFQTNRSGRMGSKTTGPSSSN